jgi:hypothetical protein
MKRVIVLVACSSALSACGSTNWSVPSMDLGLGGGTPQTVNVRVESQPAGAEARGPSGNCRTPCTLAIPANGTSSVNFALQGYQAQSVPVSVRQQRESFEMSETGTIGEQVSIDPNPVFAVLDPVPPPPPPRRAAPKPPPKPRAATPAPAPAPAPQFGPAPPPPGFR